MFALCYQISGGDYDRAVFIFILHWSLCYYSCCNAPFSCGNMNATSAVTLSLIFLIPLSLSPLCFYLCNKYHTLFGSRRGGRKIEERAVNGYNCQGQEDHCTHSHSCHTFKSCCFVLTLASAQTSCIPGNDRCRYFLLSGSFFFS